MKIAIYTDTLTIKGGGSKAVIELSNALNADIITAGYNPEINKWIKIKNKVIDLGNLTIEFNHSLGYLIEAPLRFLFNNKKLNYDVHIFTGVSSFFAARKDNNNIWLCFSPNRILYDLHDWKLKNSPLYKKLFFQIYSLLLRPIDRNYVKNNISLIISQTSIVFNRVKKYYNLESTIIFTGVNTENYRFSQYGDFFLTVSRLMSEKRISLIIEAFREMPGKKLIVVGTGPEKDNIVKLIGDRDNIKLLENLGEDDLLELYSDCLATIYIPKDEDYGLVPIESMASGKPCIAANEGGCKETVIDKFTGFLINPDKNSIIEAVKKMDKKLAERMKDDCIMQARKFDTKIINEKWKELIKSQLTN